MKLFQKTAISLVMAASLSACSDNKNEETNKGATDAQPVAASQLKASKAFEEMLSHVPAKTSYLITNSKPVPANVVDFQLKRVQALVSTLSAKYKTLSADKENKAQDEGINKGINKDLEKSEIAAAEPEIEGFFKALMEAFENKLTVDGLKELGLKANGHTMVYEVEMMPVVRYELSSKKAFKAVLSRAEEKSGYKLEWSKCGDYECMTSEKDEAGIIAAFVEDQMVISLFSIDKKQLMLDHITGVTKPENSYKTSDWDAFLAINKYKGYSDGFIKLDSLVNNAEAFILEQTKKKQSENFDVEAFKGCFAVAKAHTANMSELVFGTKQFDEKTVQYEVLVKTSPLVSTVLQGLPNKLTGMQEPKNPIMSFGMNLNMPNLRGAITQYINFLAESGEANKCEAINPADLRKAVGGISMAMSMGASQFKSVYFALDKLDFDDEGKPSKIEAFGTVVADDPMALLQMLAMVNPTFATLQLPEDGTPVKLPEGVIPPGPISPEISLGRKDQSLNIFVGNDKLALKPLTLDNSTFMWGVTDSKRYYGLMNKAMEQMPNDDVETADIMDMLNAVGEFSGVISQKIGADSRGLVVDYTINYQPNLF